MQINFQNLIDIFNPAVFVKIITLIILGFYIVFSFIVFNQVKVMNQVAQLPHAEFILKTIATINLIAAISLFLIAIVIL